MYRYCLMALLVLPLGAQARVASEGFRLQWTPLGRMVDRFQGGPVFLDQKERDVIKLPDVAKEVQAFAPPGGKLTRDAVGLVWVEGRLHATVRYQKGDVWYLGLQRLEGGTWNQVASLKRARGNQGSLLPLDNGQVLLLDDVWSTEAPTQARPWPPVASLYKIGREDRLELVRPVTLEGDRLRGTLAVAQSFLRPLVTEDGYVVINREYGLIWSFSRKDGRLKAETRVYGEVEDTRILARKSASVVHSAQPLKDGSILIAGVPRKEVVAHMDGVEEAFRREQNLLKELMTLASADRKAHGESRPTELLARAQRERQETGRTWPPVAWSLLDPEKGKVREASEPVGAWPLLESAQEAVHYRWIPEGDGSVRYWSSDFKTSSSKPMLPPKSTDAVDTYLEMLKRSAAQK